MTPYSFSMFTDSVFNESNNKLTYYTGKDCLDEFFIDLTYHVNRISKIKANRNPQILMPIKAICNL